MKHFLFLVVAVLASSPAFADTCLTPAQIRTSYNACISFLGYSAAQQKAVAAKTGETLQQVIDACQLQKKSGLTKMLANEKDYCASLGSGGGGSVPYEPASPLCQMQVDCHGGSCGASGACTNGGTDSACDNSSQCANGYCSAGGACN